MKVLVLALLAQIAFAARLIDSVLSFSPSEVRESATYVIDFSTASSTDNDAVITLAFPTEITVPTLASFPCELEVQFAEPTTYTCESSGNSVIINNAFVDNFGSAPLVVTITLTGVQNPISSAQTSPVSIEVQSTDTLDYEYTTSKMTVSATPASIVQALITPTSQVIGLATTWTFLVTPKYSIPAGSSISVTFPYSNEYLGATDSDLLTFFDGLTPECAGVSQVETVLSCQFDEPTLTITGGFTSEVSGDIEWSVTNILNPPSPLAIDGFTIALSDSAGGILEESSFSITVVVSEPNEVASIQLQVEELTVNEESSYRFGFVVSNPLFAGCKVRITPPSEVGIPTAVSATGLTGIAVDGLIGIIDGTSITVEQGFSDYTSSTVIYLYIYNLINPPTTTPSAAFTIETLTETDQVIDSGQGGSVTATPSVITAFESNDIVTASNYIISTVNTYTFDFQTTNQVPADGALSIEFPPEIAVAARDQSTSCQSVLHGLNAAAKCEVVGQVLKVYDGFSVAMEPGRIKFSIDQVTNSGSTGPSSSFIITTHPSTSFTYKIDEAVSGVTISAFPAPLGEVSITPADPITGVESTYSFSIEALTTVPQGGSVEIVFPSELTVLEPLDCTSSLTISSCTLTGSTVSISAFDSADFSPGTMEFSIGTVVNPPSTKPTASFAITTYDAAGDAIEQSQTGNTVSASVPNELASVVVTPTSLVNGELTTYEFSITVTNETPANCKVKVTPPASVTFPSSPTCVDAACKIVDTVSIEATLSLAQDLSSNEVLSFSVNSVKNPGTTEPTESFSVYTYTNDGFGVDQKETSVSVQTTTPGAITDITIVASDSLLAQPSSYFFSYAPENPHPTSTKITVTIPSEFGINTISCLSAASVDLGCTVTDSQVTIDGVLTEGVTAPSRVEFTIDGLVNPTTQQGISAWVLLSETGAYQIDTSTDVVSSMTCSFPCEECESTPTHCTSCDPDGPSPYLYDDSCHSSCKSGFVDSSATAETVCVACNSPCLECENTEDTCTACPESHPFLYENTCNSDCQDGSYLVGADCELCPNPCKTCSDADTCTSCEKRVAAPNSGSDTYLLGAECLVECPEGYLEDSSVFECVQCADNCGDCEGTIDNCIGCAGSLKIQEGECVESCLADGTMIDFGSVCEPCEAPCSTCQNYVDECTSCNDSLVLYGGLCYSECPVFTTLVGNVCQDCVSPCETCDGLGTTCSTCIDDYLLEETTCVASCSEGYLSDGINCNPCNSVCKACAVTVDDCTSCDVGKVLFDGTCLDACPSDEYIAISDVCEQCNSPCLTCSGTLTNCKSCPTSQKLYGSTCITECPADTTVDTGTICEDCSDNCSTCEGDINTCTSCDVSLLLEDGQCVSACSTGFLLDGLECIACNQVCLACETTTSNCISCPSNSFLHENWCISSCPSGFSPVDGACVADVVEDCNPDCTDVDLANTTCEDECNVEACAYDNGSCIKGETNCADGFYELDGYCEPCEYPCDKCESVTHCLSCDVTAEGTLMLLYDNSCYDECPEATLKTSSLICSDCADRCSLCQGDTDTCLTCYSPYLLYNHQCIVSCPSDISIEIDGSCIECNANCLTCEGTTSTCTSCSDGQVIQDGKCQATCNSGYTSDSSGVCKQCTGCKECSGDINTCVECTSDKLLYGTECVTSCPTGSYATESTCKDCPDSCVACTGSSVCSTCQVGFVHYSGLCLETCPVGHHEDNGECEVTVVVECADGCSDSLLNDNNCDEVCNVEACNFDNYVCLEDGECSDGQYFDGSTCQPCQSPCNTCSAASVCTSCESSLLVYDGECLTECPSGTMEISPNCVDCDSTCAECATAVDVCVECPTGDYLYEGTCVSQCPTDVSVAVSSTLCQACSSNCLYCADTYDSCTACPDGKVLQGSTCPSFCNDGYTTTSTFTSTCKACTGDCATCSGETWQCTSCTGSLYLYDGTCYAECPEPTTVPSGDLCLPCESPCSECTVTKSTCTSCESGFYLHLNQCLEVCPSGYEPGVGVCEPYCSEGCTLELLSNEDCNTPCNVSECAYDNGQCPVDTSCPVGQYDNGSACVDCEYPCNTCASVNYCSSCLLEEGTGNQLYLFEGVCYSTCPAGTYKSGIICVDCDSSCDTCSATATFCTGCSGSLKLYEGECLPSCPLLTTVEVDGVCEDCDNICAECSGTVSSCTKCPTGSFLSGGTCLPECPDGQTSTSTTSTDCVDCASSCETCLGSTTYCTSCEDGLLLHEGECLTECPVGYTETLVDPGLCTQCSVACADCDTSISYCTACADDMYLTSSNSCQISPGCPAGTTVTDSGTCETCIAPCKTCEGDVNSCSSCLDGLALVNGSCETCQPPCETCSGGVTYCTACTDGYYLSGAACLSCDATCLSCEGSSVNCQACQPGYTLSGSSCLACPDGCATCSEDLAECSSCSDGFFLSGTHCSGCSSNCLDCEGTPDRCVSCDPGLYLTDANVCETCSVVCAECEFSPTKCTACPEGETLINGECDSCDSQCATCTKDFNTCSSCADGLSLVDGNCGVCNSNCATCVDDFNTCSSCADGLFLVDGACVGCSSNCLTCEGTRFTCTSCEEGTMLSNNACVICDAQCKTCVGTPDTCTSCEEGLSLIAAECVLCENNCNTCSASPDYCTSCFDGWYLAGADCFECSSSCNTCASTAESCTSCPAGTELSQGTCEKVCDDAETLIGGVCLQCLDSCLTCNGQVDYCTSCEASAMLYEGSCIEECPSGYFPDNNSCTRCSSLCQECTGSSSYCTSCDSGYELADNTCTLICPEGQYYNGSECRDCDPNCQTCVDSATQCLSCYGEDEEVSSRGICEVPCDPGYTRTATSGDDCVECDSQCTDCEDATDYCTECSDPLLKLYEGLCLVSCPVDITVEINSVCEDCNEACLTCGETTFQCTSCAGGEYLYANTCTDTCPENTYIDRDTCQPCEDEDCGTDASSEQEESDELDTGSVPFPFTGTVVVSAGVIAATKLAAAGVSFVPATIAVWGVLAVASWAFLCVSVPMDQEEGRRLLLGSDDDLMLSAALLLLWGGVTLHICFNIAFTIAYCRKVLTVDKMFAYWRQRYTCSHAVIFSLSSLISFHCIRLLVSSLCNSKAFSAEFSDKKRLLKPLVKLSYFSLACTCLPLVVAQVLFLIHYPLSNLLWMFALDSLIITLLLLIFIIIDTIKGERELTEIRLSKDMREDYPAPDNSLDDTVHIKRDGFKELVPPPPSWFKKKREQKLFESPQPSRSTSPIPKEIVSRRKMSFPLEHSVVVEVDSDLRPQLMKPKPEDLPPPRQPRRRIYETTGEFSNEQTVNKSVVRRLAEPVYAPINTEMKEAFTELVVLTESIEEASSEEVAPVDSPREAELSEHRERREHREQEEPTAQERDSIEPEDLILQEVHEPLEMRPATQVRAASPVEELSDDVIDFSHFTPIRPETPSSDAFIERPMTNLIGQVVTSESDYAFANAYPDPFDPEIIVVAHLRTNQDVFLKKSFQGALIVDERGKPLPYTKPINREDYDISRAIIDKDDVHFAILKQVNTGRAVRVRRHFEGATVIDMERVPDLGQPAAPSPDTFDPLRESRMFRKRDRKVSPGKQRLEALAEIISKYDKPKAKTLTDRDPGRGKSVSPIPIRQTGVSNKGMGGNLTHFDKGRTSAQPVFPTLPSFLDPDLALDGAQPKSTQKLRKAGKQIVRQRRVN